MIIILFMTLLPSQSLPQGVDWYISFDKFAHITIFAVLSWLMTHGSHKQHTFQTMRKYPRAWTISCCISLGVIIEILQTTVSNRQFELLDILADTIGVFIGLVVFFFVYNR
ncbi:VanZ family protein [Persicobacter psychrovividus]